MYSCDGQDGFLGEEIMRAFVAGHGQADAAALTRRPRGRARP
jgi:hypothetical protein